MVNLCVLVTQRMRYPIETKTGSAHEKPPLIAVLPYKKNMTVSCKYPINVSARRRQKKLLYRCRLNFESACKEHDRFVLTFTEQTNIGAFLATIPYKSALLQIHQKRKDRDKYWALPTDKTTISRTHFRLVCETHFRAI